MCIQNYNGFNCNLKHICFNFNNPFVGLVLLPAGLLGSMCGMKVLSKYKLEPASILYFEIVLSIFAMFLFPSFLLACKSVTFAGSNYAFPGNMDES